MELYITSNLYLKNNSLFYETDSCKTLKLNRTNWHKFLAEYEYEKLSLGWKRRLKSKLSPRNSLWGIRDCGGEGDCLFLCIEEALKNFMEIDDDTYSVENLRYIAARQITDDNFSLILETYKAEVETGEFEGEWEPESIESKEDLQKEMMKCGNSFWGDHIIIQLLAEALDLNFIILNDENEYATHNFRLQRIGIELNKSRKTIFLSYYSNVHYQLVGYFNGDFMQTVFNFDEIPPEMMEVYLEDCG